MRYHYCYLFDGEPQSIYLEAGVSFTKLSGHRYTILAVTNLHPGLSNQPVSLVYRSEDQQTYCAPIERALRGCYALSTTQQRTDRLTLAQSTGAHPPSHLFVPPGSDGTDVG